MALLLVAAATRLLVGGGHYREVLAVLAAGTRGEVVVLGGDLAFRHTLPLSYYGERVRFPKPIQYVENDGADRPAPEWMLFGSQSPLFRPGRDWLSPGGDRYRLVLDIPYPGLSGQRTCLYRRTGGPPPDHPTPHRVGAVPD